MIGVAVRVLPRVLGAQMLSLCFLLLQLNATPGDRRYATADEVHSARPRAIRIREPITGDGGPPAVENHVSKSGLPDWRKRSAPGQKQILAVSVPTS
jgi:hypothetical protein